MVWLGLIESDEVWRDEVGFDMVWLLWSGAVAVR